MYKLILDVLDQEVYEVFAYFLKIKFKRGKLIELSKELRYTKNRLIQIIERMKEIQKRYPAFNIEIANKQEIFLDLNSTFLLSKIFSVMLLETTTFRLLDMFFKNKYVSLEKTAQQYFLSDRTIQRKLVDVKDLLLNYNINLDLKSRSLFEGAEYRIRYFFHIMYWQVFDGEMNYGFDLMKDSKLILQDKLKDNAVQFRNIDIDKFLQIVAISLYRAKRNYILRDVPEEMYQIGHLTISYEYFHKQIIQPIFIKNRFTKRLPEAEYRFLYYMFSIMTTYLPEEVSSHTNIKFILSKSVLHVAELVKNKIVDHFELSLNVSEETYLLMNIANIHSASLVFPSKKKIDAFGKRPAEKEYRAVFPETYDDIKKIHQILSQENHIFEKLLLSNERLIFQYCMLSSLLIPSTKPKIRIFHESKFGKIQDKRQKTKIKQLLEDRVIFVKERPDIVLTDYPVNKEHFKNSNKNVKFFQWASFQNKEVWLDFLEFLELKHEKE